MNFVLKRLEILKEEAAGLSRPPDIDKFLSNFCNWQRSKNPAGDREPQHWDHALILTGIDLYVRGKHGKISSQVVGKNFSNFLFSSREDIVDKFNCLKITYFALVLSSICAKHVFLRE